MLRFTSILAKLAEIIARDVKDLASFSLHIDTREVTAEFYSYEYADIDAAFSYHALVRLLDAIPPTCTNLELDTGGIEMYQDGGHLCGHIARVMPHLRHVRLRLGRLCSNFIDIFDAGNLTLGLPACPNLRCLVINSEYLSWSNILYEGMPSGVS
ncbi:hypothetical protein DIZ76_013301 [Coccidioides immitis]|nr:hypothetical protein DIZ76_013301 [Coccidioides immitis]